MSDEHDTCTECGELKGVVVARIRGTDELHVFDERPDLTCEP